MAIFAAIYHIVPRLTEIDWPSPKMVRVHYGLTASGIVLVTLALLLGGYVQGSGIGNPSIEFVEVARRVVMYIGISTLGLLVLLVAQIAFLWNLVLMLKAGCCGASVKEVAR
jgi:cytochrome c oxidase cbb3-type subunit 1